MITMSQENVQNDGTDAQGVQLDLLSAAEIQQMTTMEKIRFIIDSVRDRNIVILEQGLSPDEESKLVEVTMSEIDPDGFSGIEIESYPKPKKESKGLISKISSSLGGSSQSEAASLTVIGPADELKTIHKDESLIQTLVQRK